MFRGGRVRLKEQYVRRRGNRQPLVAGRTLENGVDILGSCRNLAVVLVVESVGGCCLQVLWVTLFCLINLATQILNFAFLFFP